MAWVYTSGVHTLMVYPFPQSYDDQNDQDTEGEKEKPTASQQSHYLNCRHLIIAIGVCDVCTCREDWNEGITLESVWNC